MATTDLTRTIAPGAQIELRDAVWRVRQVDYTSTGKQAWRCVGVSEIVRDQDAVFLEEFEPDVRVLDPRVTELVRDTSAQHWAGLLYVESLLRDVPPPLDGLCIGHEAAMDVMDFQLDPAWLALRKPRPRILIADSVGLGKTLEAGILLSELIRRGRGRRILVATTKAMLTQFQKEMWGRFSIPLVRLDSVGLQRIRSEIPTHHNPFYHFDRSIISIDTLKQNNWFRAHLERARWDVIVIDEAHNVAARGAENSLRARVANMLSRACDSLILLSATPHDGRARSFASLMSMIDPTAIANPDDYTKEDIRGLYVRRFKRDVEHQLGEHVPARKVTEAWASASPEEERAFDLLTAMELPTLDEGAGAGKLFRTGLEKALFSSPFACLEQLRAPLCRQVVADALPAGVRRRVQSSDTLPVEQALREAAAALDGSRALTADLLRLADLADAVRAIGPEKFSKYAKLLDTLRAAGWSPRKKEDRLLIFTERRETLKFLREKLYADLALQKEQIEELHGGLSDIEQQWTVEEFGKQSSKLRLLLASDVASEGLNLHYLCHRLVHFDVPWSLMVFQQRNGRIDRYGQERSPEIAYLLTRSAHAKIRGDVRILELLIQKDEQAQKNIGDPSAFLKAFDVESQEQQTAEAIEAGTPIEELDAKMAANLDDPFARLLEEGASQPEGAVPRHRPLSLFDSDLAFVASGLEQLKRLEPIESTVDELDRTVQLKWPEDLRRRFARLPPEARPDDGVLFLTANPKRMQKALEDARREESAWPRHQLLWANSPVVHWLSDRHRSAFGRHTAPVIAATFLGTRERQAIVVSGVLSNRRGQSLLHCWHVVHFTGGELSRVEPFRSFLQASRLGSVPLPNANDDLDLAGLQEALPAAVDAVLERVMAERAVLVEQLNGELEEESSRLARLESGRQRVLSEISREWTGTGAKTRRLREEQLNAKLFREQRKWLEDSRSCSDSPFLQVIAAFVGVGR